MGQMHNIAKSRPPRKAQANRLQTEGNVQHLHPDPGKENRVLPESYNPKTQDLLHKNLSPWYIRTYANSDWSNLA